MRAYSLDLRERIVAAVESGQSPEEVAERFAVSVASVYRYVQHSKQRASLAPKPPPGAKKKIPPSVLAALAERITQRPDTILIEHHAWLREKHQINVSLATVHRTIQRMGFTYKKSLLEPANATMRNADTGKKTSRNWQPSASSS
jgi:transposase